MTSAGTPLDPIKYLRPDEAMRLREFLLDEVAAATARGARRRLRDAVLGVFLLGTGLRRFEAVAVKAGDVRLERIHHSVHVRRGKGSKARHVTIGGELAKILAQYLQTLRTPKTTVVSEIPLFGVAGRPMSCVSAWRIWKRHLRAVGLAQPGRGCHVARHTRGTLLYASSRDLRLVARELGHEDTRTTMVYVDSLDEDRVAAAEAVDVRLATSKKGGSSANGQMKQKSAQMKQKNGIGDDK